MNTTKVKGPLYVKDAGILDQLNNSIYALASHLCQYLDILRQSAPRPNTK